MVALVRAEVAERPGVDDDVAGVVREPDVPEPFTQRVLVLDLGDVAYYLVEMPDA